eukprot:1835481-Rhodomonas_salina.1
MLLLGERCALTAASSAGARTCVTVRVTCLFMCERERERERIRERERDRKGKKGEDEREEREERKERQRERKRREINSKTESAPYKLYQESGTTQLIWGEESTGQGCGVPLEIALEPAQRRARLGARESIAEQTRGESAREEEEGEGGGRLLRGAS